MYGAVPPETGTNAEKNTFGIANEVRHAAASAPPLDPATVIEHELSVVFERVSVARAVYANTPLLVGMPVIAPVAELSTNPGGSVPLTIEYVYGPVPPVAVSAEEYAAPSVALLFAQATENAATVIEQFTFAIAPIASCACAVYGYVPGTVGIPVSAPVDALRDRPGGRFPEPPEIMNVYGGVPPVATNEEEYGRPTDALLDAQVKLRFEIVMWQPGDVADRPPESTTWIEYA